MDYVRVVIYDQRTKKAWAGNIKHGELDSMLGYDIIAVVEGDVPCGDDDCQWCPTLRRRLLSRAHKLVRPEAKRRGIV